MSYTLDPTTIVMRAWVVPPTTQDAYLLHVVRYGYDHAGHSHSERLSFTRDGEPRWIEYDPFEVTPPTMRIDGLQVHRSVLPPEFVDFLVAAAERWAGDIDAHIISEANAERT